MPDLMYALMYDLRRWVKYDLVPSIVDGSVFGQSRPHTVTLSFAPFFTIR